MDPHHIPSPRLPSWVLALKATSSFLQPADPPPFQPNKTQHPAERLFVVSTVQNPDAAKTLQSLMPHLPSISITKPHPPLPEKENSEESPGLDACNEEGHETGNGDEDDALFQDDFRPAVSARKRSSTSTRSSLELKRVRMNSEVSFRKRGTLISWSFRRVHQHRQRQPQALSTPRPLLNQHGSTVHSSTTGVQ